jgi:transketolase
MMVRDHRVYCVAGDGELGEGQIWEAAMAAGHYELGSLVVIVDRNRLSIDGHDLDAILDAYDRLEPPGQGRPQVIIADTVKGRGVRRMEGDVGWHVGLVGADYDEVIAEISAGLRPEPKGRAAG